MKLEEFILSRIAEEASEIAQAAIKCQRFTPDHAHYKESNVERLVGELGDLEGLIRIATGLGLLKIDSKQQEHHIKKRTAKELHYMQLSYEMGCVDDLSKMNACHECKYLDVVKIGHCTMYLQKPQNLCTHFAQN